MFGLISWNDSPSHGIPSERTANESHDSKASAYTTEQPDVDGNEGKDWGQDGPR